MVHDPQCRASRQSRQIQEKAQDYSGFGLKSQTPARKSAQLSRAPARAAKLNGDRILWVIGGEDRLSITHNSSPARNGKFNTG
jgi:hypothetical protein